MSVAYTSHQHQRPWCKVHMAHVGKHSRLLATLGLLAVLCYPLKHLLAGRAQQQHEWTHVVKAWLRVRLLALSPLRPPNTLLLARRAQPQHERMHVVKAGLRARAGQARTPPQARSEP